ncbi:hypothetical protein GM415_03975 [Pseudodesulfovibrio cashew]|uniref:Sulfotransferase n=1 Tax=Pseudodesulfovibrio cashew TaxID=2678688 RepID=A0A6I6JE10_9BACT|nr:sulfotransferase family 2 domain-containing protein [Pseudodesulfovibrio cashew]QGY39310.1 hypothetical protein GM415_03975 [Pseudodesulfovibrio cashew]
MNWPAYVAMDAVPSGSSVLLYGAGGRGGRALELLKALNPGVTVLGFVDSFKRGRWQGLPVHAPEDILTGALGADFVIVTTFDFIPVLTRLDHALGEKLLVGDIPMPERKHAIISHGLKAIYLVMPKVASTTLEVALAAASPTPIEVIQEADLSACPRDYFSFTFVRNPYDRMVSIFRHEANNFNRNVYRPAMEWLGRDPADFANFVEFVHRLPDGIADIHVRSQHRLLEGVEETVGLDFAGHLESLNEDFARVAERLEIPSDLGHITKSKRGHYRDYCTPKLLALIGERYRRDFELFGYELEA